jgi:Kef-type K+ transport system membrane component KefB
MYYVANVVALILVALAGLLFARLGLHGMPGYIASGSVGIILALVMFLLFTRKRRS